MLQYAITGGMYRPLPAATPNPASRSARPEAPDAIPLDALSPLTRNPNLSGINLLTQIRRLLEASVDYIQIREKHLDAASLASLSRQVLHLVAETGSRTRLLLNTRADIAAATNAHGVHLTSAPGGLLPAQVRDLYRSAGLPVPVVSRSCHSLRELETILPQRPDLILFSPVFGKSHHGFPIVPPTGLEALRTASTIAHPTPVLALGGVTPVHFADCLRAGASGVAGIRLYHGE